MKLREVSNLDDEFCEGLERTEFCQRQKPPKNPAKHVALEKLVRIPMVFWGGWMFFGGGDLIPKKAGEEMLETLVLGATGCKMDHPYPVYE